MTRLFEKTTINGMELSNRFVRSATWEGMATEDGAVTPPLIETMSALAEGGVGLIISSHAYVRKDGQAGPWQLGVYKDELIDGLREMTEAVHERGGTIVMQLNHAGKFAPFKLTGQASLAASDGNGESESPSREMTLQDIRELVAAFADAAGRAKAAGFDGVQIHSAHGYMLNQFLSPAYNRRQDEFGGDIANRARVLLDVYRAIRENVGNDYPILAKLNSQDFIENGLAVEESLQVGRMLSDAGLDALELSGGTPRSGRLSPSRSKIDSEEKEAYFREEALAMKRKIDIPLILVGGIRSLEVAERLVEENMTDYISLCRPLIWEPGLINRWKSGDRRKAFCTSCNLCFKPILSGDGVYCEIERKEKEK
jgi:2,4-dienoyl-CoA reductase-like NADH-dependent reductase (Old Yellow Enzyme family)